MNRNAYPANQTGPYGILRGLTSACPECLLCLKHLPCWIPLTAAHSQDVGNGEPPVLGKVCLGGWLDATLAANPLYPFGGPPVLLAFVCRRDSLFQTVNAPPDGSHLRDCPSRSEPLFPGPQLAPRCLQSRLLSRRDRERCRLLELWWMAVKQDRP